MASLTIPVGKGTATGIDPSLTDKLQESVGVVYEPGDPAAHKMGGRTALNDTPIAAAAVSSLNFVDAGSTRLIAVSGDDVYVASPATGVFTDVADLTTADPIVDVVGFNNKAYLVSGQQADSTTPFGAYAISSSTAFRMGLAGIAAVPTSLTLAAGPGPTGTYQYWTTEYDSTNNVESAYVLRDQFADAGLDGGIAGMSPANQSIDVVKPPTVNASADKWRLYRTINGGEFPIGWLVEEAAIATTTINDNLVDADLVLNEPYRIVTINGDPESMDYDPNETVVPSSIASFQGSLIATTTFNGDLAWTPALEPHSWPRSYRLTFPVLYGGQSKCVRSSGDVAYVMFTHETFMVNYLPDQSDSVFDTGICSEKVANYGTPSKIGACIFTGWGGQPILFMPSLQGPILITGRTVDRAVKAIDWTGIVSLSGGNPSRWKSIDNPDKWRVEFYFQDDPTDTTSWKCLHFYYDTARVENTNGPLPEMAWTGPHPVPGPGTYGFASNTPTLWTASAAADGLVYVENTGTVDEALLTDASGTIPFSLKTSRIYPKGIDAECRADRVFISKSESGVDQDYAITLNAHRENGLTTDYHDVIDGSNDGVSSMGFNASLVSFDVEINADGVSGMAPINNITVRLKDEKSGALKTVAP